MIRESSRPVLFQGDFAEFTGNYRENKTKVVFIAFIIYVLIFGELVYEDARALCCNTVDKERFYIQKQVKIKKIKLQVSNNEFAKGNDYFVEIHTIKMAIVFKLSISQTSNILTYCDTWRRA